MSPPHRSKYTLAAIGPETVAFRALIANERHDDAYRHFREHLDLPTLHGLETCLKRSELLAQINIEKLTGASDKSFVLYHHALSLNLTGGWPNRAIPIYEQQIEIATRLDDAVALSQSLGHYAKALRQVGRFRESEAAAIRGLRIIRERGDRIREAVNLYWLGMGLAHRGEAVLSEIALNRSLRIFGSNDSPQAEGVVNAFLAQRSLWLRDAEAAIEFSDRGTKIAERLEADENYADLHGARKVLIACLRMKGDALASVGPKNEAFLLLENALGMAREIEFVEEELPALRALATLAHSDQDNEAARNYLSASWHLAERGNFRLYNADSYNILARIESNEGNRDAASTAALKAFDLSLCDGSPFAYKRGVDDAMELLKSLNDEIPDIEKSDPFPGISIDEIDPPDEFAREHENES